MEIRCFSPFSKKKSPTDFDKTRDIDTFVEQNADAETCATRMVMICQLHGCHWPTGYAGLTHGFFEVAELLGLHSIAMAAMDYTWLVVLTILKHISQLGWLFPIYGKIKHVANHQPVLCVILYVIKWCVVMLPLGQRDTLTQNNDRPSMLFPEIEHCQQAACTTAPQQILKWWGKQHLRDP